MFPTYYHIEYTLPFKNGRNGVRVRKYWTKPRLKFIRTNSKSCTSMSDVKGLKLLHPSKLSDWHTILSWPDSIPSMHLSLAEIPSLWHFQHPGVSITIQVSLSHIYAMVSQGLQTRTLLPLVWPQWLCLTRGRSRQYKMYNNLRRKGRPGNLKLEQRFVLKEIRRNGIRRVWC